MSSPSPPKQPDPVATAQAQTASNRETAITQAGLNNYNQVTPYGNLTYTQSGTWGDGTPQYTATQTLSPNQQEILNQNEQFGIGVGQLANSQVSKLQQLLGTNFTLDGTPQGSNVSLNKNLDFSGSPSLDDSAVADRINQLGRDRLDPRFAQEQQTLESDLRNKGIVPGTEAYDRAIFQFNQSKNDAYNQLAMNAQNQAFSEQATRRGMSNDEIMASLNAANQGTLAETQFNNANQDANRNRYIQELLLQRNQPINETTALMSGSQVSQPGYVGTPQTGVNGTNVADIINQGYANQMAGYNAQQANRNGMFGALGSLGSAFILSDKRTKKNVEKIGRLGSGLNIYKFDYKKGFGSLGKHVGVMAQEVEKKMPEAVAEGSDGLLRVDYAQVMDAVA